jgi:hypothetical protein
MGLSAIQEIERAIRALKPRELQELYSWLDENCPTVAFSPILRRAVWTRPSIAHWTTKITVGAGRSSRGCGISPPPIFGRNTGRSRRKSAAVRTKSSCY